MTQPASPSTLDTLEDLMAHQRAVRKFTGQPVDDALVARLIRAATRAPSAKNAQCLRFVVVRDPGLKRQISELYEQPGTPAAPGGPTPWSDVPVLIFMVAEDPFGDSPTGQSALVASVYPGVQNLLLAAQAAGLGAVLTTSRAKLKERELRALLNLPENVDIHAVIPLGYPAVSLGRNKRMPVREVAFRERYGEPW
jgi:nitroreductase